MTTPLPIDQEKVQAFPASDFVGYDLATAAIEQARVEAAALHLANARFEVMDVARLGYTSEFDFITTFDAVHDQADPAAVLRNICRALRPDGSYLMFEPNAASDVETNLADPFAPWLYGASALHCMTVSLASGGVGLGTAWGEQVARQMLAEAGFQHVEVKDTPRPQNVAFVCTKE